MKIVVLDGYTVNPGDLSWDCLKALGECTIYDRTPADQTVSRIGDAQLVLTNKTVITEQTLCACPNIKYIGVLATGYNVVDIKACSARGIVVTNVPAYSTASVAQHVFALLLEACVHVQAHGDAVMAGRWSSSEDFCFWDYPLVELDSMTLGVIGFGQIGQRVAKIATALGMKVVCSGPRKKPEMEGYDYLRVDELLKVSDVVTLHCPLTKDNKHMINSETLALMKRGAVLINTARGPLVDDAAVRAALDSGQLGYFLADVATIEPMPADNPLLGAQNCILTPHIAWAPLKARTRLMDIAVGNVSAFIEQKPKNTVC